MTAPRFSVIIAVRNVAALLDACLASVGEQSFRDHEVLVVDDASDDATPAVVERRRRDDARVSLWSLPTAQGVGAARNLGVARATGEYLVFLDGDDAFTDVDVLAALAARLGESPGLDLLLYDYQEVRPCGLVRPVTIGHFAGDPGPGPFAARDRPDVMSTSWVCWNTAYRRRFVVERDLAFPSGTYEDFPWTISCLLAAERIGVLDRICVDYRKCRSGSLSSQVSAAQMAIFDQIGRIRSFVDGHPEYGFPGLRPLLVANLTGFLRGRVNRKRVIPAPLLPEFHRRAQELQDWQ